MTLLSVPPFVLFLFGALVAAFTPARSVGLVIIFTALAAGTLGFFAPDGVYLTSTFLKYQLELAVGTRSSNMAQLSLALAILLISIRSKNETCSRVHVLGLCAAAFASGAISSGDLVSMYLFLELLVITIAALIALGKHPYSQSAAIHFMVIQLFASIVFKFGMSDFHHQFDTYSLLVSEKPLSELQFGWALLLGMMVKLSAWPLAYLTPMSVVGSSPIGRLYVVSSLPLASLVCLRWFAGEPHADYSFLIALGGLMIAYALVYSFAQCSEAIERSARWVVGITGAALIALASSNDLMVNLAIGLLPIASMLLLSALPSETLEKAASLQKESPKLSSGGLAAWDTDRLLEVLVKKFLSPTLKLAQFLWSEFIHRMNGALSAGLHAAKALAGDQGLVGQVWGIGPTSLWVIALLGLYGVVYLVF